jgi:hypothetical protein
MRSVLEGCDRCHAVGSPLALRAAAGYTLIGLRLSVVDTPQSITIWPSACFEAFLFSHRFYT